MSTHSTATAADEENQPNNPQAPPSSAEEAAALLGASISFDNAYSFYSSSSSSSSSSASASANPPVGMHSIFTVQSPSPNGVLFVRLYNLREWLRWHHIACGGIEEKEDDDDDNEEWNAFFRENGNDPLKQSLRITFPKVDKSQPAEPFTAARSILAVLMKLLDATTSTTLDNNNNNNATTAAPSGISSSLTNELKIDSSFSPKKQFQRPPPKPITKQHKPLPPLLSTPLRKTWADCLSLCLSLGSTASGTARTDTYATLTKMMEVANLNPRSKSAGGGVRLAALEVMERIGSTLQGDTAKRLALYAVEVLQCCHRGLLSGGAGEPGHRAACVRAAWGWMVGCRRAWSSSSSSGSMGGGGGESFTAPGALEERAAMEAIKLVKRAASDKYPEVRMGAAVLGGVVAPMLVRNVVMFGGGMTRKEGGDGASPLAWLEEVTQLAMRNLDDESAGVATAWAATLARCFCASAEYGKSVRDAQSEDQANKRSADVDDEEITTDNNLDLAGKFKAFSESRRAAAATSVCSSALDAVKFLVSHFVKCGGESTSNKCGGSFSIGGRASRIGYSAALTEFLRLQAARGEFALADALHPVLDMVGASFDKQVHRTEKAGNVTLSEAHYLYAPSSPYSSPEKKAATSISTAFLNKNPKGKSSADSTIGRLLTSMVIRKGISENMSELAQLSILREITVACRASVAFSAPDGSTEPSASNHAENGNVLNRHQIQVALVEMSHLIIGLGEAASASLEEIMPVLKDCLAHRDHGVRLEASTVYAAVAQAFPTEGRKFVIESLSSFLPNMDAIQSLSLRVASETTSTPKGRFRRGGQDNDTAGSRLTEELMHHQCHMHGNALAVSMLMHEFPHVAGGIARVIVDKTFDVCEKLLQCQSNETFVNANPSAVCTCIRAGYCMLSGLFTMGVDAVVPHVTSIFSIWQTSSMNVLPGVSKQSSSHDLLCVESILSSVVSFLKFCPTLLLSVPDALNRITSILEKIFPLVSSGGRFELEGSSSIGSARLSNARSAVMEAYSWLPPGSFPLSADRIFSFAAKQIQELSADGVICSILKSLVSREDDLIDAHTLERAVSPGQVGSSAALDNIISLRSCDIVTSYERETVLHLLVWRKTFTGRARLHESLILGSVLREGDDNPKPTPLHEVGTWRQPLDPIPTAKVRVLDSSIHVFAATFGLQDPHAQSDALRMLESMYVSTQAEKSNRFNVNGALITDSQGKVKPPEDDPIPTNTIAVVLACLQAIPLHEATYGTLIGKGPPWMERATHLLLQLIPSPSDIIRRGAAEGLSYLATLGVSEDAHTLQSTILHALDEIMKGNNAMANPRTNLDVVSLGRAGALLSLACIQRTSKRMERSKIGRVRSVSHTPDSKESSNDAPPVIIMMTRLLPSLATNSPDLDSSIVRTHAIHSFGVLISNSFPNKSESLSPEQIQIVWKAVEAIESSFLGGWSAVMLDYSKGREREKFAWEPALAAAIFRLMTTLLPWLSYLVDLDRWIASRFSCYASTILDCLPHPIVRFEGSVFFECLSACRALVHPNKCCVVRTNNTAAMAMPFLLSSIQPGSTSVVAEYKEDFCNCESSVVQRSALMCMSSICSAFEHSNDLSFNVRSSLFSFLHDLCGRRRYQHILDYRSLAQSHASINLFDDLKALEAEVVSLIHLSLNVQAKDREAKAKSFLLLQWLLFCRYLVSGVSGKTDQQDYSDSVVSPIERLVKRFRTMAQLEAYCALNSSNPPRWQIKCVAANVASVALHMLIDLDRGPKDVSMFNVRWAKSQCNDYRKQKYEAILLPLPAFYLEEMVLTACSASASTSNHSELLSVQIAGIRLLTAMFGAFGDKKDYTTHDDTSVLDQFSSQIISAVKHSLKSELQPEESALSGFHLIFFAGCEALLVMIKNGFISDPVAIKRMLKPITLSVGDTPFMEFPSGQSTSSSTLVTLPHSVTDDLRSYPLFRLSKLLFVARISMMVAFEEIDQTAAATITKEFEKDEEGRAIHSAAAAIDGFLLMTGCEHTSGLTFKNRMDLDDTVVEGLVENWSILCASAFASLIKVMKSTDEHCDKMILLQEWIVKLSAVAFSGLTMSLAGSSDTKQGTGQHACSCIYAIRLLIRDNSYIGHSVLNPSELSNVVNMVSQSVIFPTLGMHENSSYAEDNTFQLLKQSCGLFEDICLHNSELAIPTATLLRSVVSPLASFQEGNVTLDGAHDATLSSCVRSSISLLRSSCESDRTSLEKALSQFVFQTLIKLKSSEQNTSTGAECLSLLQACFENTVLSEDEWTQMALFAASNDLWDAWSVLASAMPAGVVIECSMYSLKKSLGDLKTSSTQHVKTLAAFRHGLHSIINETPNLVGTILQLMGYEIFQLFRFHSMNMCSETIATESRLLVCAECVKLIMMAFQHLTSVEVEETKIVVFLVSLFSLLVESVSYNGMPNHPSGKSGADEKIGKMCAQVFVHTARTTPPIFKSTMTAVSPECRSTIETAVRADMSGYAATTTGPVKKKLNLKGFVR